MNKGCNGCRGYKSSDHTIYICRSDPIVNGIPCVCMTCIVKSMCRVICDDLKNQFKERNKTSFKHAGSTVQIQEP